MGKFFIWLIIGSFGCELVSRLLRSGTDRVKIPVVTIRVRFRMPQVIRMHSVGLLEMGCLLNWLMLKSF